VLNRTRSFAVVLAASTCAGLGAATAAANNPVPDPIPGETRSAILVGNNWDGTTDIVDPDTFERLGRVDVVPDLEERKAELALDPVRFGFFLAIRGLIGEGHDQLNDDVFSSRDGRTIYVSRPSLADVVAIDLASRKIIWRTLVDGYRSDHMAISADGTRLLVSASTGNVVHELDTATGAKVGIFASGDSPHENVYSKDGRLIYHASIGRVYLPFDRPPQVSQPSRGGEFFQVVDARTKQVLKRIDMGDKLEEAGFPGMSAAVRPMALSPDETRVYFQVSFFHGFVEYDLVNDKVLRVAKLPLNDLSRSTPPEAYVLDSAHHGLSLDPAGKRLCVAGTSSDYAAIVDRANFATRVIDGISKPYWSTNSADGKYCYVSAAGADEVHVISYETRERITRFPVGFHPQRVRNAVVRVADFPRGAPGEPFRLQTFTERGPIGVRGDDENVGCRAAGAERLRLLRCAVQLKAVTRAGRRAVVVGAGERLVRDARSFKVDVDLNAAGRALLRQRGKRGFRATVVARGIDSVGRRRTATKRVVLRRGR
jgi:hypothetical protein